MVRLRRATKKDKKNALRIIAASLRSSVEPVYDSSFVKSIRRVYHKRDEVTGDVKYPVAKMRKKLK